MTPLSPAAQAIDFAVYGPGLGATRRDIAATALRAAVDQVLPARMNRGLPEIRSQFLAIAAELDGTTPTES